MRVAAVCPKYLPASRVGSWITTHEYLRHLVTRGHDVRACSSLDRGRPYRFEGIRVHRGTAVLPRLVVGADVVFAHLGDRSGVDLIAERAGVPRVVFAHSAPSEVDLDLLMRRPPRLLVWNTEHLRDGAPDVPCDSMVAPPPIDPDRYRCAPGDYVTQVNMSEAKGVGVFSACASRMPDTLFLGVSGGYGYQRRVHGVNVRIAHSALDMRDVFRLTRVLLMPSRAESWGRVAIEAAVSGIPTIASDLPGPREALGSAGVFVDPGDVDGWVREIRRLKDHEEWSAASRRAVERVGESGVLTSAARVADTVEALVTPTEAPLTGSMVAVEEARAWP